VSLPYLFLLACFVTGVQYRIKPAKLNNHIIVQFQSNSTNFLKNSRLSTQIITVHHQSDQAEKYLKKKLYQEAAWEYLKFGDEANAEKILNKLVRILMSTPIEIRTNQIDKQAPNMMVTYRLKFEEGVEGIFKIEAPDPECVSCTIKQEVAVYKIDSILGFYFTPLTIYREVILPEGQSARGSLMYYIHNAKTAYQYFYPGKKYARVDSFKSDKLRFFDAIIGNEDRHGANWLVRDNDEIVAIDHNRTFQHQTGYWKEHLKRIKDPLSLDSILQKFKNVPETVYDRNVKEYLTAQNYRTFISARNEIIKMIERRIN